MMEVAPRQMTLQYGIYKRNKRLSQSANDRRKPMNQAVSAYLSTSIRSRTAYLHCIKDGTNIDPCMGSGHILVYAFDVLMQIYESEGYNPRDAAKLILEKSIYGLEIDKRAYQLAYFSLMMKARQYNRRILTLDIKPNVFYFIDSNRILEAHLDLMGAGLMPVEIPVCKENIPHLLNDFSDATEYGSLLKIGRAYPYELLRKFAKSQKTGQMTLTDNPQNYYDTETSEMDLLQIIDLAETLAQKYDVVVTNPPYMGGNGMGAKLSDFVKKNYSDSKSDLFAVFIEKCGELLKLTGYQAMITQHAWMFLSSYEKLRSKLLQRDIVNMAHLGARAFEEIGGEVVQTTAFILSKHNIADFEATYIRLVDYGSQKAKEEGFLSSKERYYSSKAQFLCITGCIIAYWLSNRVVTLLRDLKKLSDFGIARQGLATSDNKRFLRLWTEIKYLDIEFNCKSCEETQSMKWYPYIKGGNFRKWSSINEYVVNYQFDGREIKKSVMEKYPYLKNPGFVVKNTETYFKSGITWNDVSTGKFCSRFVPDGFIYADAGPMFFSKYNKLMLSYFNSCVFQLFANILCQGLHYSTGHIPNIPFISLKERHAKISELAEKNIDLSKTDWDAFENSWNFKCHPLICDERTIAASFGKWEREAAERFNILKANEEELNRIFIDIYGLQDELTPEVDDKDVTVRRADLGREIRSLISYAVGCMFGRYSPLKDGLLYAGGEWNYNKIQDELFDAIGQNDFTKRNMIWDANFIDKDNVIPICDDEYFDDDILGRFVDLIGLIYGAETLEENLKFIADALGGKGTPREVIREYFLNGFYKDHCKIYQKRPIYWLFDSGKKNGFKALIYLHRYSRDLLAKLRTDYVHEQQERYRTQISHIATALDTATGADRARLLKQQDKLTEQLKEITAFEEKVHHLADQHIEIDLDDGVKKNYEIFTDVLAKI